jgi:hypothetical protein
MMRVTGEVWGGDDAHGNHEDRHEKYADGGADDHGQDAGGFQVEEILFGNRRDKPPRQTRQPVDDDVQQNYTENGEYQQGRQTGQSAEKERSVVETLRAKTSTLDFRLKTLD